jgi:hypothetical protein
MDLSKSNAYRYATPFLQWPPWAGVEPKVAPITVFGMRDQFNNPIVEAPGYAADFHIPNMMLVQDWDGQVCSS